MPFQQGIDQVSIASQMIVEANNLITHAVMNAFLFTWNWWISLAFILIPWGAWAIYRPKKSSARILSAGLLVMLISAILDSIGTENGMWSYPVKAIPLGTLSFAYQLSIVPVLAMFFLQFKPHVNPFVKAILYGGLGAYIGMPLLAMINLYKPINWAYTYSFFILTLIYLCAHWFSRLTSFDPIHNKVNRDEQFADRLTFLRRKEKV